MTTNQDSQLDVLAIAAHPDDVELSVGGTLIKLASMGYRTGILDLTRGEAGTRGTPELRRQEAEQAAQILGAGIRENLDLGDAHIWVNEESRVKLVRALRRLRPRVSRDPTRTGCLSSALVAWATCCLKPTGRCCKWLRASSNRSTGR